MINILIPIADKSNFFNKDNSNYPKPLYEIDGVSIIQIAIENLNKINLEKKFIFVLNKEINDKYHFENILNLITNFNCEIIKIEGETKGATCSALMAIEFIENNNPLIICNYDQLFDCDLNDIIKYFDEKKCDAGVITFETIHPRWSYVKLDDTGKIIESAEKNPISKNAIAGFYYFQTGYNFVNSAKKNILKDGSVEGKFFIAPTLNELILEGKHLINYNIKQTEYHTFYSKEKIEQFLSKSRTKDEEV